MMAVVKDRAGLRKYAAALDRIRALAESCARQLTGWAGAVEKLPFDGKRRMPEKVKRERETAKKTTDFRARFLAALQPSHPLYHTPEAEAACANPPA